MEEDLKGYLEWITEAEDLPNGYGNAELPGGQSLKVDVGKHKGDPVVMGLLKSTMFPLQQVLEGERRLELFSKYLMTTVNIAKIGPFCGPVLFP